MGQFGPREDFGISLVNEDRAKLSNKRRVSKVKTMKKIALILGTLASFTSNAQGLLLADILFKGGSHNVGIELSKENGEERIRFSVFRSSDREGILVSNCSYTEASLSAQIQNLTDADVHSSFRWIFLRSDYSSVPIERYYRQLKALLELTNPGCAVESLDNLKAKLAKSVG